MEDTPQSSPSQTQQILAHAEKQKEEKSVRGFDFIARRQGWNNESFQDGIARQKMEELRWRVTARKRYGRVLMGLLLFQNIFIAILVWTAYQDQQLGQLSWILGTLIVGTLGETAYIVRIIVTELFKDINYQDYDHAVKKM